jgi:tRNA-dihydrouridine synthase
MGKEHGMRHSRKHLSGYTAYVPGADAAHLRRRLVTSENPEEVESLLEVLFEFEEAAVAA